mgnify:CR=1 FL=1
MAAAALGGLGAAGLTVVGLRSRRQRVFYIQNTGRVCGGSWSIFRAGEQAVDLDYGSEAVLNENSHFWEWVALKRAFAF